MSKLYLGTLLAVAAVAVASMTGCGKSSTSVTPDAKYVATTEPAGAVNIHEARTTVKDKDEIVLVGRIGGSEKPFVEGLAAFTIVDQQVPHCPPDEGCPTPWDYCCETHQLKDNIATIKVVDASGKLVANDARQLLGVKELNLVVVRGTAERDEEGNLVVLANQIFVKG